MEEEESKAVYVPTSDYAFLEVYVDDKGGYSIEEIPIIAFKIEEKDYVTPVMINNSWSYENAHSASAIKNTKTGFIYNEEFSSHNENNYIKYVENVIKLRGNKG